MNLIMMKEMPNNGPHCPVTRIAHKQLYKDVCYLGTTNFKTVAERRLLELSFFASNFDVLKLLLNDGENTDSSRKNCLICSTCPSCVLQIHDKEYDNVIELSKVICTLSVTEEN